MPSESGPDINLADRRRWLTVGQAATLARTTERTIWRWVAKRAIRAVTTAGGRVFIDRETLVREYRADDMVSK
jgi:excisionase family DNA binding protein